MKHDIQLRLVSIAFRGSLNFAPCTRTLKRRDFPTNGENSARSVESVLLRRLFRFRKRNVAVRGRFDLHRQLKRG